VSGVAQWVRRSWRELRELFNWWQGALSELATWLWSLLEFRGVHAVIVASKECLAVWTASSQSPRGPVTVQKTEQGTWPDKIVLDAESTLDIGKRVVIVPVPEDILREVITLPERAAKELPAAMELAVEAVLPLPKNDVYIRWSSREAKRSNGAITVPIEIIRRDAVDAAIQACKAWGVTTVRLMTASISSDGSPDVQSLKAIRTDRIHSHNAWTVGQRRLGYAAMTLVVLAGAIQLFLWRKERVVVDAEIARLAPRATVVEKKFKQLGLAVSAVQDIRAVSQEVDALEVLAIISEGTPAQMWANKLEIIKVESGFAVKIEGTVLAGLRSEELLTAVPGLSQVVMNRTEPAGTEVGKNRVTLEGSWAPPKR
jgi:hypothetical protein